MKSWRRIDASVGIAVAVAMLVLSCGSRSADEPASGDSHTRSDFSVPTVDRAIRANSDIVALLGDDSFVIEDHRPLYVENEYWGVSALVRLDETTTLNGPWITSDLGIGGLNELSHDERDQLFSGIELTPDDYVTRTDTYEATTEFLLVAIQPDTSTLLHLVPFTPPPGPWGDSGPTNGSGS